MYQKAVDKLRAEMTDGNNNPYIQVVGAFLLQQLGASPGAAEKVMDQDKTILKSLEAMRKEAEKKKVGNCAVLTDQEGFDIVLKYFEIEPGPDAPVAQSATSAPAPVLEPNFDITVDDLL